MSSRTAENSTEITLASLSADKLAGRSERRSPSLPAYSEDDQRGRQKLAIAQHLLPNTSPLPRGPFSVIVADPPWPFSLREVVVTHRGRCPYPFMTIPEIEALSVADIAAEDAYLLLWSTKDHLIHGESASVMRSWGFNVKSVFTWLKTTKAGDRIRCGVGHYGRNCTEFVLVGTKGSTPSFTKLGLTNIPTAFMAPRGQHSEKPSELMDIADRLGNALGGNKVELFARKVRSGWTSWGAEIQ